MDFQIKTKTMSRRAFCEACNMIRNGVKSRIALEHTCGLERGAIPDFETEKHYSDLANNPVVGGNLLKKYKELQKNKPKQ